MVTHSNPFRLFAPAKINLFLHVTGKRADGYHTLQSLIVFANIGDELFFEKSDSLCVEATGPFSTALSKPEDNLIYKVALLLARHHNIPAHAKIKLVKKLPVASGLGGGSSDAATALKGLVRLWNLPEDNKTLSALAEKMGADVPACLCQKPLWAEGAGEKITLLPGMPDLHFVLVNPLLPTSTAEVFKNFSGPFSPEISLSPDFISCRNDLTSAAISVTPVIRDVLAALSETKALLCRLSGSGATCFGIYESEKSAESAARALKEQYPEWWVVKAATQTESICPAIPETAFHLPAE